MRAFRATLEELEGADLLLHVVDASDGDLQHKMACVEGILTDLDLSTIPRLTVFNKADKVTALVADAMARRYQGVAVSAVTGANLDVLVRAIAHKLWQSYALDEHDPWALEGRAPSLTLVPKP
jgi:GTP-binding protein HflX